MDKRALLVIGVGALAGLVLAHFAGRGIGQAVNDGINGFVHDLTGGAAAGGEDTLGGVAARLREWLSGDDARIRAMLEGAPPAPAIATNPVDLASISAP